jgi:hypothetical protein
MHREECVCGLELLLGVVSERYLVGHGNSVGSISNASHGAFNVAVEV